MNTRLKNQAWLPGTPEGAVPDWERVIVAVLLDLRDEMQSLNQLLTCHRFLALPDDIKAIRRNTTKKRKKKAAKPAL